MLGVPADGRYSEDLPQLAAASFELAGRLCGACKNFHRLWPYHRLAQATGGDVGIPEVQAALAHLLSQGGQSVLIAGCADSGLLAVTARAAGPGTDITVVDRCGTPLELCRRFAQRWALPVKTIEVDLADLSLTSRFDVVFAHMLLQYIPAERHATVMSRLHGALRPGGRLVLAFRTGPGTLDRPATDDRHDHAARLVGQLKRNAVTLPVPEVDFCCLAETYFDDRRNREANHRSQAEIESLVIAAGFEIEELTPIAALVSTAFAAHATKRQLRRYLAIAKPSSA